MPAPAAAALLTAGLDYDQYCAAWPAQFKNLDGFGAPLLDALFAIETLSLPENSPFLEKARATLPPGYDLNTGRCSLHQCVTLWLICQNTPGVTWPLPAASKRSGDGSPTLSDPPPPTAVPLNVPCSTFDVQCSPSPPSSSTLSSSIEQPATARHHPTIHQPINPLIHPPSSIQNPASVPSTPQSEVLGASERSADGPTPHSHVLDLICATLLRFLILPKWTAEAISLFILHTYAWELREVTTYLGIESPQHRCGKSTLLSLIRRLVCRPEVAAHISTPAVFRTIARRKPTFIVDETEKVLRRNLVLTGILNASYVRDLAYVVRVVPQSKSKNGKLLKPEYIPLDEFDGDIGQSIPDSEEPTPHSEIRTPQSDDVARFCCWCPKAMAQIGHFPETLADRCIIITMQRKTLAEKTERLRRLTRDQADTIRRQCIEFVQRHRDTIASAEPAIPDGLNDRAADIWEPLFVLADLAGGDWPQRARQAALALSGAEQTNNIMGGLLLDCILIFTCANDTDRMFTRDLVRELNLLTGRPWRELNKGKPIDDLWLARQLRPFAITPQTVWINQVSARGYLKESFLEPARRYVSKADWQAYQSAYLQPDPPEQTPPPAPLAPQSPPPPAPAPPKPPMPEENNLGALLKLLKSTLPKASGQKHNAANPDPRTKTPAQGGDSSSPP